MEIKQGTTYKCRVKLRETYCGRPLRESVRPLDGKILNLTAGWENSENHPGEWAFVGSETGLTEILVAHGIAWIASGDLEIIDLASQKIEKSYRMLEPGEAICPGDEFQRIQGEWVKIRFSVLKQYYDAVGKALTFTSDSRPVRREVGTKTLNGKPIK